LGGAGVVVDLVGEINPVKHLLVGTAVVLAALSGCGTTPQSDPSPSASSAAASSSPKAEPSDTRRPIAAAGGLCKLLSYQQVDEATKVEFDYAAAGKSACALQVQGHDHPDLTLGASATKVKSDKFFSAFAPDGAKKVSGLGKAAYRAVGDATSKAGPTAEVGWLAGGKFYLLTYTFEPGASKGQAGQMATRLVTLAKGLKTG
jgi:hypothetical protein